MGTDGAVDPGTPQVTVWGRDLVLPRATNAVLPVGFKAVQGWRWDMMIDSVTGSREVEKEEEGGTAGIRGHQELISGSEESCLSAVGGTETRLEFPVETDGRWLWSRMDPMFFLYFGDEGEIGRDGTAVLKLRYVLRNLNYKYHRTTASKFALLRKKTTKNQNT